MRYLIVFLFFSYNSFGQSYEIIDPVTQQSVVVYSDAMKLPKVSSREAIKDCNKRIEENPQDWQAYYIRSKSNQILNDLKATIDDTDVLIKNSQLNNFSEPAGFSAKHNQVMYPVVSCFTFSPQELKTAHWRLT
jgi:hypothetical protein